jgi:hypothetical protein
MTNRDLLKEAIADAKAVKEVAIANAKAALEEAFTPHLQSMFEKQITEMEHTKEEPMEEDFNLEELLKELEEAELEEAGHGHEMEALDEAEDEEAKDVPEETSKDSDDTAEIDIDLDNMTPETMEKLEAFIDEVIDELIASGQIEGGEEKTDEPETGEETMTNPEELAEMQLSSDIVQMAGELGLEPESLKQIALAVGMSIPALIAAIGAGGPAIVKFFKEKIGGKKLAKAESVTEIMGSDAVQMAGELGIDYETVKQMAVAVGMSVPVLIATIGAGGPAIKKFFKEKLGGKKVAEQADDAEKAEMAEELREANRTIRTLKRELNEINLLNSKLLYTNKIFKAKNLSEAQKLHVLSAFDKAESVKETKLVYETLKEGITKIPKTCRLKVKLKKNKK